MRYIGIDPGSSGGIACIDEGGNIIRVSVMPPTEKDILLELNAMLGGDRHPVNQPKSRAVIEYVQAFPKMGVSSAFNFGKGYGGLLMALTAAGIRFDIVVPRKWQGGLACLSGGDKNVTKARAQQQFPGYKITHAIADALLIAEYCRRLDRGSLTNGKESSQQAESRQGEGRKADADEGAQASAESQGRQGKGRKARSVTT